jgi:hypothetical protein
MYRHADLDYDGILNLIKEGEGELLEWKDSRIFDNSFRFARSMSAMANLKGGLILIGVKDDGTVEGIKYEKGHEELIMNIASEKCDPPIRPQFAKVSVPNERYVYVVRLTGRKNGPFHGVKTKDGLVYFIRVGSTIREMSPNELSKSESKGVEIEPYTFEEKGLLIVTEKLLSSISRRRHWSLEKTMLVLGVVGALSVAGSISLIFVSALSKFAPSSNYRLWIYALLTVWLVLGTYLCVSVPSIAAETRCPVCKAFFKFRIVKKEILSKRKKNEEFEEWKVRNQRHCDACGYEEEKVEYEEHRLS